MSRLLVGIETGGTKIVCAAAPEGDPRRILTRTSVATGEPDTTLAAVGDFIRSLDDEIAGVGIAAFGPLDLDRASPTYGSITSTPKAGWDGVDTQELDAASRAKSNEITAFYLAQLAATLYFTLGIELVVFGGGVLKTPGLIEALQEAAAVRVGPAGARGSSRDLNIARTELDGEAGLYGSLLLAEQAAAG